MIPVCKLLKFTSQTRVKLCPDGLLEGYYRYGNKRDQVTHLQCKWVEKILSDADKEGEPNLKNDLKIPWPVLLTLNPQNLN